MRIVSLLPSATEIVYALGLEDHLYGVTHECDFPPGVASKRIVSTTSIPHVTGASQADIDATVRAATATGGALYSVDEDAIRSMQPDLILAQDLCRVCAVPSGQVNEALEKIGCRAEVVSLDPDGLEEILAGIEEVGRVAGADEAARRVTTGLRSRLDAVRRAASNLPKVRVVALEWLDPPFVGGHWVPEMVEAAGGDDVLGIPGRASREVTWRDVETAQPETVVYMPCGYFLEDAVAQAPALFEAPGFRSTPAARNGRVYATDASSYFSRPGPRVVDGVEILGACLHPETFGEPPADRAVRVG